MSQQSTHAIAAALLLTAAIFSPVNSSNTPPPRLTTDHFIFFAPQTVSDAELSVVGARAESVFARATQFLGRSPDSLPIRVNLYQTLEEKGLATGYTLPAHAMAGAGEVFAALETGFEGEVERVVAGLVVLGVLGRPRTHLLETGLAMYFTSNWRGRGYQYWAAKIGVAGRSADLIDLLDNRNLGRESYLIARPLAGSFVAWAVEEFGRENLLEKYATWRPAPEEVSKLEVGWNLYLERLHAKASERSVEAESGGEALPSFQKGFCHAHEGYQVHNGYISRRSDEALKKLSTLGVNAVSLTPFTYMSNPRVPSPLPFSHQTGAENDESVIHAAITARQLGFSVMIKPHVWVRGSWPGDVEMASDEDWDSFFDYYWRWIRHYAVLSEMYGADILCVGVELSRATVGHEGRWREMFDSVRRLYGGRITYAANWGEEFELVSFWDSLDFIGVNFYYPLSEQRHPSDGDLREGVDRALARVDAVAQRFGRTVIITEVGFTSTPAPWIKPYERDRRAPPNEESQARCYQAFCDGLSHRDAYVGVYWWKWPSFPEYGGSRHTGFTPNGKIAEEVVKRWFAAIPAD